MRENNSAMTEDAGVFSSSRLNRFYLEEKKKQHSFTLMKFLFLLWGSKSRIHFVFNLVDLI